MCLGTSPQVLSDWMVRVRTAVFSIWVQCCVTSELLSHSRVAATRSRFSSRTILNLVEFILQSVLTYLPVPPSEKLQRSMMLPPPCSLLVTWWTEPGGPLRSSVQSFSHFFHAPKFFPVQSVKLQAVSCHVPFTQNSFCLNALLYMPDRWCAAEKVALLSDYII